jgi:hypothetical protein
MTCFRCYLHFHYPNKHVSLQPGYFSLDFPWTSSYDPMMTELVYYISCHFCLFVSLQNIWRNILDFSSATTRICTLLISCWKHSWPTFGHLSATR